VLGSDHSTYCDPDFRRWERILKRGLFNLGQLRALPPSSSCIYKMEMDNPPPKFAVRIR